jgi:hypothetical protein
MPKRIIKAVYLITLKLGQSLKRFPESLILITAVAILLIDSNHNGPVSYHMKENFPKLPMMLFMSFLLFLCFRVLNELNILKNRIVKIIIWLLCLCFLSGYYFVLLPDLKTISVIRFVAVCTALMASFLFLPYIKRESRGFEMYIMRLIIDFLVTYLYAGVLYLGLIAIVFTVNQLFTLHISGRLYFDIWLVAAIIFAPAYFLGGIPENGEELDESNYSKVLKILFLYIVMPILSIYTLILYAYFAKVLATQQWPQGMVSNLVLWYSFIAAAIIFLIKPLTDKNIWAYRFSKIIPIVIIPLLFMCFWAMGIRIKAFGITENRYYVLVGALWVLGVFIYWIFRGGSRNVLIPVSIAIIAILTIIGPQSAFSVSLHSQTARLSGIFTKYDIYSLQKDNNLAKGEVNLSNEDKNEITSILRYLKNTHGFEKVSILPSDLTLDNARDYLGFDIRDYGMAYVKQYYSYSLRSIKPVDISGYRYYADIRPFNLSAEVTNDIKADYDNQTGILTISDKNNKVYTKNIKDFTDTLPRETSKHAELDVEKLTFKDTQNGVSVMFIFRNLSFEEDSYGTDNINDAEFSVFIK